MEAVKTEVLELYQHVIRNSLARSRIMMSVMIIPSVDVVLPGSISTARAYSAHLFDQFKKIRGVPST